MLTYVSLGACAELQPKHGSVNFGLDITYLPKNSVLMTPLAVSYTPGNKFKLRTGGGFLPYFKIDNHFKINVGGLALLGIEFSIDKNISIFADGNVLIISHKESYPNLNGEIETQRKISKSLLPELGLHFQSEK